LVEMGEVTEPNATGGHLPGLGKKKRNIQADYIDQDTRKGQSEKGLQRVSGKRGAYYSGGFFLESAFGGKKKKARRREPGG